MDRCRTAGLVVCLGLVLAGPTHAQDRSHDGAWFVSLVCDDTQDRKGQFVKGYDFRFPVLVEQGRLSGQYGEEGKPSSVVFTGTVQADGAVEIRATGNTGRPEYTVGHVPQGSNYSYTLTGTLGETSGTAVRREVRPCKATLTRKVAS